MTIRFLTACVLAMAASAASLPAQDLAIRNARVFDGERVVDRATVVVRNGVITAVGPDVAVPAGIPVIDGTDRTLLPGLIDAHTHTFSLDQLEAALAFGVTTVLDQFTPGPTVAGWRAEQAGGQANARADIYSAGTLVTAPGGHGTQYGVPIPTIEQPVEADAFVAARLDEGSDWIKIVKDEGSVYGLSLPTVSDAVLTAVAAAARKRDRLAVVHVGRLSHARAAVEGNASGLVHVWVDSVPDAGFVNRVRQAGMFVTPTLTVMEGVSGSASGTSLISDERTAPWLTPDVRTNLDRAFPRRPNSSASYEAARTSVTALHRAGVPLLAGSDAPNPGTAHGVSMHRELELLVGAGLTRVEALRAATSAPADAYGLSDRGRIRPGLRADLLLVNGDPTADITATRAIEGVWKAGYRADRERLRAQVATAMAAAAAAPKAGASDEPVSTFNGSTAARYGSWTETTDAMAGGKSLAAMAVADGALKVTGDIKPGLPYAWAGAMYFPAPQPMAPVDLSSAQGVSFRARGDGATYRLMVFSQGAGMVPAMTSFTAGSEWQEFSFPWSAFRTSGKDVMGIAFVGGPTAGTFELWLDDLRFRP